jgi:hypothetical protein
MSSGDVGVCPLHLNPYGFFMPRRVVPILRSVFDKHVLRRVS